MTRFIASIAVVTFSAVACQPSAPVTAVTPERRADAIFVNGDFEDGGLTGWTITTCLNKGITYPPASRADLKLQDGGVVKTRLITGNTESLIPAGLDGGASLRVPKYGRNAAVVNEGGSSYNANTLTQTFTVGAADVDPADGKIHVRFALAPVLNSGGHGPADQPYFWVTLTNVTKGSTMFGAFNFADQPGVPWHTQGVNFYTDWQSFDISPGNVALSSGDTVKLEVIAAGCSQSGHWGEIYVDGFGAFLPGLQIAATAPQLANQGSDITYQVAYQNRGQGASGNTIVDFNLPANVTFVSYSAPGASCTAPVVGASSGLVSCNVGSVNPSANGTLDVTVRISGTATGKISAGNYSIRADNSSALLGPLVETAITVNVQYADLQVAIVDDVAAVGWSQPYTFSFDVTNAGPATADGATVTWSMPAQLMGATWSCVGSNGGSCTASGADSISDSATTLPSGARLTYSVVAVVVSGTSSSAMSNLVVVATPAGVTDNASSNNQAIDVNSIGTLRTLTVTKAGAGSGRVITSPAAIDCGAACIADSTSFIDGTTVSVTATATSGHAFTGWSGACTGTGNPCTFTVSGDMSLVAAFALPTFDLTASAGSGGTVTPAGTTAVALGASQTFTVTPSLGQHIVNVLVDGVSVGAVGSYTFDNVSAAHTLSATFAIDTFTVTASAGAHGSVAPSGAQTVGYGSSPTFTFAPEPHYGVADVLVDGASIGAPAGYTFTNVSAAHTLDVTFAIDTFVISASGDAHGSVSCSSPVAYGSASTCTVDPAPGYEVFGLTDDGADVTAQLTGGTWVISGVSAAHTVVGEFRKSRGGACGGDGECGTGHCVDGVCCNTACAGQCEACAQSGSAGTCAPVSGAPQGARAACATDGSSCAGVCDGAQTVACAYPSAACRAATCGAGVATFAASCDGAGACPAVATVACSPYLCGATACATSCSSDAECVAGHFCGSGACLPLQVAGASCSRAGECGSGNCVDGVCCNTACGGQCEACAQGGSVGTCSPVTGAPQGGRAACASDGSSCGGACDGAQTSDCAYPVSACRSASCAAGTETHAASCDGAGACPAAVTAACTPFICGATACASSCAGDAQCASGHFCSSGACLPRQAIGTQCSRDGACGTGKCVDGVCCNAACDGQCEACDFIGHVGQCTAVYGAPHGARTACATDGSSCGGICLGRSRTSCAFPDGNFTCRAASCASGVATLQGRCDGQGSCPAAQTQTCTPYACGANACVGNCAADSECAAGNWCAGGVCQPRQPSGASCGGDNQCSSGFCTDGVCCNVACNGQCEACDATGSVGTCSAISGAPHAGRPECATDHGVCGGTCSGVARDACAYPTAATACRAASCANGVATLAAACDGTGACPSEQTQACSPFVCAGNACLGDCTTDNDCQSGSWCSAGVCLARFPSGGACGVDRQCASGFCTDGICCDVACDGQCEACDAPGSIGTCTAVQGAPHGARGACDSDGSACGGQCDGLVRSACDYPAGEQVCRSASCTAGVATLPAVCNGQGSCPAAQTQGCAAYVCGANACAGDCQTGGDCASGNWCSGGVCRPKQPSGGRCGADDQCGSGFCTDGVCCDVACNGQCEACDVLGHEGTCSAVTGAPHQGRPECATDHSSCGGTCGGINRGACAYPTASTQCRAPGCAAGVAVLAAVCDGTGACPAEQTQACAPFVCGANACRGDCATDASCLGGSWCSAGVCVAKLPAGGACGADSQCGSGFCADGFCCNTACDGQCEACDVEGHEGSCAAVVGVPHAGRADCATDHTSCGGTCGGTDRSACAYPNADTGCRAAACSGAVATLAAVCDGTGACPAEQRQACAGFACGATACLGNCTGDADCHDGSWCSAGVCVARQAAGGACGADAQCASGFCTDGVCCNVACDGQCEACDVGGSVGTCSAVLGPPHGARTACDTDGSLCGGQCDGITHGACEYPGAAQRCRAASCSASVATLQAFCDGQGACPSEQTQTCTPYTCGAGACAGNCQLDTDCASGNWCSAGVCRPKVVNGATCGADSQCGSGFCTDGVCCNVACNGQCEACDVAGQAGVCSVVTGAPHQGRPECASDHGSCGGTCGGTSRNTCTYPQTQCRAPGCTSGLATLAAFCDGAGACPSVQRQACAPFVCGANACLGNCGTDADCRAGNWCSAGVCAPAKVSGGACSADRECGSGFCTDGVCCTSACSGQCQACDVTGSVGTCAAVTGAPHGARQACESDGTGCGGLCDGALTAACAYPTVSCREASCSSGTATLAATCSGGHCPAVQVQACGELGCGATVCLGDCAADGDCAAGSWCSAGVCTPKRAAAQVCAADGQCGSGHCVDGVCCDTACDGVCEACDVAGSAGTCAAASGPPHGARPSCAGDGTVCAGTCDGNARGACSFPSATVQCVGASCAGGLETRASRCDGAGTCAGPVTALCGTYACGATACQTACARDADCSASGVCVDGACQANPGAAKWKVQGGGMSCSAPGGNALGLAALLVVAALLRSRRRTVATFVMVAASAASAQSAVNRTFLLERFVAEGGAGDVLAVQSASVGRHLRPGAQVYFSYADVPLRAVMIDEAGVERTLAANQETVTLVGSMGLFNRVELGVALPITITQSVGAEVVDPSLGGGSRVSLSDLRVQAKVRLFDAGAFGFALSLPVTLPTAGNSAYAGYSGPTATPTAIAQWRGRRGSAVLVNVGVALRAQQQFLNVTIGSAFTYGIGGRVDLLPQHGLALMASVTGEVGLLNPSPVQDPLEAVVALRWMPIKGLALTLGAGPGLSPGYGTPRFRVVASVGWVPDEEVAQGR